MKKIEIDTSSKEPFILVDLELVTFSDGIREILKYKNWSREDMAHYLKVSPRTVDGWISGRKPSKTVITALSFMIQ